jgi:hypothetical protein
MRVDLDCVARRLACVFRAAVFVLTVVSSLITQAAITWDNGGTSSWWFDPVNWSATLVNTNNPNLPAQFVGTSTVPTSNVDGNRTDVQINNGWDNTGEGVVYDPVNDPFFGAAANLYYPSPTTAVDANNGTSELTVDGFGQFGPQHIWRMYIARNSANKNLLTIKSGDLLIASTTIIGRSGSTASVANEGKVVQTGGRLRLPRTNMDLGLSEAGLGWGNGVYDYRGGTLEVADIAGVGIRLAHGSTTANSGASGVSSFIMHNPTSGGHVRTFRYESVSYTGSGTDGVFDATVDPDGVTRGVGITRFHYENGGTRPIQVQQTLRINNGLHQVEAGSTGGTMSSRLDLQLSEAACAGAGCIPNNIGLFDVDFGSVFGGIIDGFGLKGDIFSSLDNSEDYIEGSTVSALFGGTRYDWTISYTGNITWDDAGNSDVGAVTGAGTGVDVVLIGLGSVSVGIPGDFDSDSDVDGRDFLIWQRGGSPGGVGNTTDLGNWQTNYGTGTGPLTSVTAVPEPGSLALVAALVLPLLGRRRV